MQEKVGFIGLWLEFFNKTNTLQQWRMRTIGPMCRWFQKTCWLPWWLPPFSKGFTVFFSVFAQQFPVQGDVPLKMGFNGPMAAFFTTKYAKASASCYMCYYTQY